MVEQPETVVVKTHVDGLPFYRKDNKDVTLCRSPGFYVQEQKKREWLEQYKQTNMQYNCHYTASPFTHKVYSQK